MRYIVHGIRQVISSVEIDAESPEEAVQIANTTSLRWDEWDSEMIVTDVTATF